MADLLALLSAALADPREMTQRDTYDDEESAHAFMHNMAHQMQSLQRDMDRLFAHINRMSVQPAMQAKFSPQNIREAEDTLALNPVKQDKQGKPKLEMNLDMRAFKPEEIKVKTKAGKFISVEAKHEDWTGNGKILRKYNRTFSIPEGTDLHEMDSTLSPGGVLTIKAPILDQEAIEDQKRRSQLAIKHEW